MKRSGWGRSLVVGGLDLLSDVAPHAAAGGRATRGKHALRDSLELVRQPDIAVFLITSFGVYLTCPMVYQVIPGYLEWRGLPRAWISTTMTLGQVTEIAMLAVLPWLLRRFGVKVTLMLGIAAWFIRFLSLALDPPLWLAVGGNGVAWSRHRLLHGRWSASTSTAGAAITCGPAPRRCSWCACRGWEPLLGNLLAGEIVGRTFTG